MFSCLKKNISCTKAFILFNSLKPENVKEINFVIKLYFKGDNLYLCSCSDSLSLPLILDVGSSSLWEINKCIEYTGVQGVAVSGMGDENCLLKFVQ